MNRHSTAIKQIADTDERALDEALKMTFPASDPVAVNIASPTAISAVRDDVNDVDRHLNPATTR